MRLFTALDIPGDVRARLVELAEGLRPLAKWRWSRAENLHITTKFVGEWPAGELGRLKAGLGGVARAGAIEVSVRGLGWYPNPHHPRVLFAGIEAGPGLGELHRATDAACAGLGVAAETKKYSPHLTLARLDSTDGLAAVRGRIAGLPSVEFGRFAATKFGLYESAQGKYHLLEEYSLL